MVLFLVSVFHSETTPLFYEHPVLYIYGGIDTICTRYTVQIDKTFEPSSPITLHLFSSSISFLNVKF